MSAAPARTLRLAGATLALGERPLLMGVINASPDSFSDSAGDVTLDALVARAHELAADGADLLDVGGESARTDRPAVEPAVEAERLVGVIERIVAEVGLPVSAETYKPEVARAALAAGAALVNDVSALRDPDLASACAEAGAGLVLMHTVGPPKHKVLDHPYGDVAAEVASFLRERIELACSRGMDAEQLLLDPGPDFGKSPAQTVAALRGLGALHDLRRPILLAVSRKDFVGAITRRPPRGRLAGTLAAVAAGVDAGCHVLRVHDVAAVVDFLAVQAALRGEREVAGDLRLGDELRHES